MRASLSLTWRHSSAGWTGASARFCGLAPRRRPIGDVVADAIAPSRGGRATHTGWIRPCRFDQGGDGARRIGCGMADEPIRHLREPRRDRLLRLDRNKPAARIERRRPAEPQGEIERLAEEHDEVRLAKHLRVAAERGIVDAARTFHRDHRAPKRVLQRGDEGAAAPRAQRRRCDDQRPLRGGDLAENPFRLGCAKDIGSAAKAAAAGHCAGSSTRLLQHVERQTHMHRAGSAGARDPHGAGDVVGESGGRSCSPRGFGHRLGEIGLPHLLKGAEADLVERGMSGQQQHRRFRCRCRAQRADRIGMPGAAGHQRDARPRRSCAPRHRPCARRPLRGGHERGRSRSPSAASNTGIT